MSKEAPIKLAVLEGSPGPVWSVADSVDLYHIDRWGLGYFDVNPGGQITCQPLQEKGGAISLMAIVAEAKAMGLSFPLQIRFQDLLRHRVRAINELFQAAIAKAGYQNRYQGVFPIKVNQLREVIEEILDAGQPFAHGLEVGSRAELVAALPVIENPDSLIICNGYKDDFFIRLALLGQKIGRKIILVLEKLDEVERIIRLAGEVGVIPQIGIRMRLHSKGSGQWAESSGDRAKFGLNAAEALNAWQTLQDADMGEALKMVHFHIGSQVPDIAHIKQACREAARYYAKFCKLGAPMGYLDVGGGLAIDYDGSGSAFHSSMNYSLQEYAETIVSGIRDVCDEEKVDHPVIISESGRSTVAHHAVLIVEAFANVERRPKKARERDKQGQPHKLVEELNNIRDRLGDPEQLLAAYHSLQQIREESVQLFDVGLLDLISKAQVEDLYWEIAEEIVQPYQGSEEFIPEEIQELAGTLSDQYICNFSIFQSLLDNWAIGQQFPIIPIHRLGEKPDHKGTLVDITCDSEGKIDTFIDLAQEAKDFLPLHSIGVGPYYLGIFLTGAYQDIMGDQHNLFGRINELHVFLDPDEENGFYVEETIRGSTVEEVLTNTQYVPYELVKKFKATIDRAIRQKGLKSKTGMRILAEYRRALADYTYLSE